MAVVELTREQLLDAVRGLPEKERIQLIADLLSETNGFPQGEEARRLFKQLRGEYRMAPENEQRLSLLSRKSNEGTLSVKEQQELDKLLEESHELSLQLALAVVFSGSPLRKQGGRERDTA